MFNRIIALAATAAFVGAAPVALSAKTHHKHHMSASSTSAMHSHGSKAHKTPCRDKKTGRFIKCA